MTETGWPGEKEWPADLRAAMDRVSDTMRRFADSEVGALRAALSIALEALADRATIPTHPEVVVMFAEEAIDYTEEIGTYVAAHTIQAGEVYLVCPVCGRGGDFIQFTDGTEYASISPPELISRVTDPREPAVASSSGGWEFQGAGDWGLSHQSYGCYERLDVPEWFEIE